VALSASGLSARGAALRPFQVRDSVEMSYFGTLASSMPEDLDDDGIVSPDGRHFVKVTHRGMLPAGLTEGTIWLFDTASIRRSIEDTGTEVPKPSALVRMSAAANGGLGLEVLDDGNTITDLKWSDDGKSLTFLGRNGRANRQLFRVSITTRTVTALTPPTQDVLDYARSHKTFVYLAGPDADLQSKEAWVSSGPGIPDVSVGTATPLMPLLYPHFRGNAYGEPLEVQLWQIKSGHATPVVSAPDRIPVKLVTRYWTLLVSLSPDGTHAVTISNASKSDAATIDLRYRLTDLHSGQSTLLSDAPLALQVSGRYRAAWSPDSARLAITKVSLSNGGATQVPPTACDVAIVVVRTSRAQCASAPTEGEAITSVEWLRDARAIHARFRRSDAPEYADAVLRDRDSGWSTDERAADDVRPPLELDVHEGLNDPPVLVATDPRTGKNRTIFDPNPQLAKIALGSVQIFQWKDSHGQEDEGGLVLPADYTPGKRYGLVIQTHGFNAKQFFRTGYSETANAGRALAGRDLAVLQVREPHGTAEPGWQDATNLGVDVYLAAIDKLAADGIVDPARVGITGYSYSGWLVAASITRAPDRFAAAEIANSDPVTLTGYYENMRTPLPPVVDAEIDQYVGAKPYGEGLKTWFERVPSFSTDKITAPVLFQPADPWHLLGLWDMYAAMVDQRKPVELQYIRGGEHNIRKPSELLAHQEMIVDWFDFWLNGHEDSDAGKTEQYARWRSLRELKTSKVHSPQ
jgi:dipeptidyl aminopeptidase/acylaminoacyl peptidase